MEFCYNSQIGLRHPATSPPATVPLEEYINSSTCLYNFTHHGHSLHMVGMLGQDSSTVALAAKDVHTDKQPKITRAVRMFLNRNVIHLQVGMKQNVAEPQKDSRWVV